MQLQPDHPSSAVSAPVSPPVSPDPPGGVPVPSTPGMAGYLLVWAVTVAVTSQTVVAALMWSWDADIIGVVPVVAVYVGLGSVPFAVPGLLVLHLLTRPIPSQAVHVVVAGVVGGVCGLVASRLDLSGLTTTATVVVLAVAVAVGRGAAVPWVQARRDGVPVLTPRRRSAPRELYEQDRPAPLR